MRRGGLCPGNLTRFGAILLAAAAVRHTLSPYYVPLNKRRILPKPPILHS